MITGATPLYAVIGDPVAHSLSPLIHNQWMAKAGLDAVYVALRLETDDAERDLRALVRAHIAGLNVTLPHKAAALNAALHRSREAERIGAANTLVREERGWSAHNTDIEGFRLALRRLHDPGAAGRRVVLIGAGGAARAAAADLNDRGAKLVICNRSRPSAERLAAELAPHAEVVGLDGFYRAASEADLVVNSASLGHAGESLPDFPAGKGRPFLDLSYGKSAALQLAAADRAGWRTRDGLVMLVGQAAGAFRLWFGLDPDVDGALAACQARLEATS